LSLFRELFSTSFTSDMASCFLWLDLRLLFPRSSWRAPADLQSFISRRFSLQKVRLPQSGQGQLFRDFLRSFLSTSPTPPFGFMSSSSAPERVGKVFFRFFERPHTLLKTSSCPDSHSFPEGTLGIASDLRFSLTSGFLGVPLGLIGGLLPFANTTDNWAFFLTHHLWCPFL